MPTPLSNLTTTQKGLVLVLVPVAFELVCVAGLAMMLSSADAQLTRLSRQEQMLFSIKRVGSLCAQSILQVLSIETANDAQVASQKLNDVEHYLQSTINDYQFQKYPEMKDIIENAVSVKRDVASILKISRTFVETPDRAHRKLFFEESRSRSVLAILSFDELAKSAIGSESLLNKAIPAEMDAIRLYVVFVLLIIILFSITITLGLVRYFTANIQERLKIISSNAERLAAGRTLLPPITGDDEIAKLDQVLHESNALLTDYKKQERAIIDNAADVICALDKKLRFQNASEAAIKLWQIEAADLLGTSLVSLLPESEVIATRESFERITQTKMGQFQNVIPRKSGEQSNFMWTVRWSDEQQQFFCVVHDVTERVKISELKREFLAMVSHDLRTPLSSVGISFAMLLSGKRGPLPKEVEQLLLTAEKSSRMLRSLIDELLELEKLESNKLSLDLQYVRAFNVCAAAKESLGAMASLASVSVQGPTTDAAVLGDESRLVQAITNLLSNAIKYSPAHTRITIEVQKLEEMVMISVSDQGPGIAPEERSLVFEKFRQSEAVSHVSMKSTGIGLAIVKLIVEAHGGEVGVLSEIDHGSTFWLKIPLYSGPDADAEEIDE
jgi:PAS domain S-box-containing protein